MASLKNNNFPSSQAMLGRQKGKRVIYVEGESDKKIFENYWFIDSLEKVSFQTVVETQGCGAVVRRVAKDRLQGIDAFGIVDRDKLMADSNWSLLRETDNEAFEAARPYAEVKITQRWELESYLIEPVVLEDYLAPACGGRVSRPIFEVVEELLAHADALVPHAALNQTLHLHGKKATGDGYTKLDDREMVEARIHGEQLTLLDLKCEYQKVVPLIDAFAALSTGEPRQRLEGLLRILNGKAMLERVKRAAHIQHDITYLIAKEIKRANLVPAELAEFIHGCCA